MQLLNDKLKQLVLKQIDLMLIPDAASWATELEQLLVSHGIGTSCMALIIDGDLAKDRKSLFQTWREGKESTGRERSVSIHEYSTSASGR